MAFIIVDIGQYHGRTNRVPPKKGEVTAVFMVGDTRVLAEGKTFEAAINAVKKTARQLKVSRITLVDVQPGFGWKADELG